MHMIDVGEKAETMREAVAEAVLRGDPEVLDALWAGQLPKGEARPAAQLSGILAAKRTPELLPMCHPIRLDSVEVELSRPPDLSPIHGEATERFHPYPGTRPHP
jgi:cyclic pyranopterin phosphate synthase